MIRDILRLTFAVLLAQMITVGTATAQTAPENVILTVSDPRTSTEQSFSLEMLAALPRTTISTSTPWTPGISEFTGVSLSDFLAHIDVDEGRLRATALNDYVMEIDVSDAADYRPIIAYLRDGAQMPVRNKGPLWIIYPLDDLRAGDAARHEIRMVWQLTHIDIVAP